MTGALQHKIGVACEFVVAAYLALEGYDVFFPAGAQTRADLIYLKEGKSIRVQVKSSSWSSNKYVPKPNPRLRLRPEGKEISYEFVSLVRRKHDSHNPVPYTEDEIDEVWVVGTHLWCIPISVAGGRKTMRLRGENPNPRKLKRDYDAADFVVVQGSQENPYKERLKWNGTHTS